MRLHNTLTGTVEDFVPIEGKHVGFYTCGPTVYKRPHIGNYRSFLAADVLKRALIYLGYTVTHVTNITDVGHLTEDDLADAMGEDKLQREARERKLEPLDIAREIEEQFHEDLETLGAMKSDHYPRATDHVDGMIEIIKTLIEKGHAYEVDGNVYFSVDSFPDYGKLSGNTLESLNAGASGRTEEREDKRDEKDFALWKRDADHLMQWDSPWGRGFPGWHIECSAMSMKYLGKSFDIHSGGPDNIFPHHECEIAQSEAANDAQFVRMWIHPGFLQIGGEKMSKSKGGLFNVPELIEMGYSGKDIRYALVQSQYRTQMQFDLDVMAQAKTSRARLSNFVNFEMVNRPEGSPNPEAQAAVDVFLENFEAALRDDLSMPSAVAAAHELATTINRLQVNQSDADIAVQALRDADAVLGVLDEASTTSSGLAEKLEALIAERVAAREAKDFATSDAIRDRIAAAGIELLDTPQGTRWKLDGTKSESEAQSLLS